MSRGGVAHRVLARQVDGPVDTDALLQASVALFRPLQSWSGDGLALVTEVAAVDGLVAVARADGTGEVYRLGAAAPVCSLAAPAPAPRHRGRHRRRGPPAAAPSRVAALFLCEKARALVVVDEDPFATLRCRVAPLAALAAGGGPRAWRPAFGGSAAASPLAEYLAIEHPRSEALAIEHPGYVEFVDSSEPQVAVTTSFEGGCRTARLWDLGGLGAEEGCLRGEAGAPSHCGRARELCCYDVGRSEVRFAANTLLIINWGSARSTQAAVAVWRLDEGRVRRARDAGDLRVELVGGPVPPVPPGEAPPPLRDLRASPAAFLEPLGDPVEALALQEREGGPLRIIRVADGSELPAPAGFCTPRAVLHVPAARALLCVFPDRVEARRHAASFELLGVVPGMGPADCLTVSAAGALFVGGAAEGGGTVVRVFALRRGCAEVARVGVGGAALAAGARGGGLWGTLTAMCYDEQRNLLVLGDIHGRVHVWGAGG